MKRASLVDQTVKNQPTIQETWVQSLSWEDPLEEEMATTLVFLFGNLHRQRSLASYGPCKVAQSVKNLPAMQHTQVQSLEQEYPL